MKKGLILLAVGLFFVSATTFGQGKFSGLAFGDYFYNISADTAMKGTAAKNYNGFQFRRIYFSYDENLSEKFAFRFRTEDDQGEVFANGKIGSFVKDAYLKWMGFFSGSDLTFGMQPTPAFDISEGLWGYRSLEKTIMDLHGVVGSRDIGVSLRGKIDEGGMLGYWVMVGNGASTGTPETDKYKSYYVNIQAKPVSDLTITLFEGYASTAPGVKGADLDKATTAIFADYGIKANYNVGVELFSQNQANKAVQQGYSFFGSYFFTPDLSGILRYDIYDPNTSAKVKGDMQNLLIAGVSWAADKNVWFQPHIEYTSFEKPSSGTGLDASLTGFLTFYFTF
ncbi:MAG TPA: hypothetical protein VMM58_10780 [Bacteroidota bacterium]|nr:hypothetical protein [Bacteroidota bacterium]